MITKPTDGTQILTNDDGANQYILKDAAGVALAADSVAGLTAGLDANSKPVVFAAVPAQGQVWSAAAGTDRGIALLKPSTALDALTPYDANDFTKTNADNKAVQLSLLAVDKIV